MSLSNIRMSEAIVESMKAVNSEIKGDIEINLKDRWDEICGHIVDEIINHDEINVSTNVTVDSVSAVTPGGGVSGPGSGTGTGTGEHV